MTTPHPEGLGAALAMENALADAGMKPSEVDYINAHGTRPLRVMSWKCSVLSAPLVNMRKKLAVSSTKSMTGHLLGAAGSIEAIFCILALRDQVAPPTINLDNPSEGCDLNFVPHKAQKMKMNTALSNSFGFGGTNGTLIFRKVD